MPGSATFVSNIDMSGNEIQNLKVHVTGTAPAASALADGGKFYYDSGSHTLKYYDGGALTWRTVGTAGSYLPLTGGILTGNLTLNNVYMQVNGGSGTMPLYIRGVTDVITNTDVIAMAPAMNDHGGFKITVYADGDIDTNHVAFTTRDSTNGTGPALYFRQNSLMISKRLDMNAQRITNMGAATSGTDALRYDQVLASSTTLISGLFSGTDPAMNGTAAVGSSAQPARSDHVHPSDTSRVAKGGDTMTGTLTMSGGATIAMGGANITGLADGVLSHHAATYGQLVANYYLPSAAIKIPVRVASTASVGTYNNTGGPDSIGSITAAPNTVDGVTLAQNDRILLKDHSTGAANGVYQVVTVGTGSNGEWYRLTEMLSTYVKSGMLVVVSEGTVNGDTGWMLTTNNPITVGGAGGTSLTFTKVMDIPTDDTTTNATMYPMFKTATTNGATKLSSSKLTYNPSTGTLSATTLSGSLNATNLTGTVDIARLPTGTTGTTVALGNHTHSYQPLDGDLTAIAALATTGYARRTGTDAWTIDSTIPQASVTNLTTDLAAKVTGPASATDNAIVRFDATTGKLVQNSGVTISDTNVISGLANGTAASDAVNKSQLDTKANTTHTHAISDVTNLQTSLDAKAPLNSPVFTGTPQAPTPLPGTSGPDIATTAFVSAAVSAAQSGLDVKQSVRLAESISDGGLGTYNPTGGTSGRGQITGAKNTLDGVALAAGNRVLVWGGALSAWGRGIYVVTTLGTGSNGVWDRASDFDSDAEASPGAFVFVEEGNTYADCGFVHTTNAPVTIGGSSGSMCTWTQFSGPGTYSWGNGLSNTGNVINVGAGKGIIVNADDVQLNFTTGFTDSVNGSKTHYAVRKYSETLSTAATSYVVTHNLNTQDIDLTVRQVNSPWGVVFTSWEATSVNTATVYFATAPLANTYRVTVMG